MFIEGKNPHSAISTQLYYLFLNWFLEESAGLISGDVEDEDVTDVEFENDDELSEDSNGYFVMASYCG